jgi:hypothetical protein
VAEYADTGATDRLVRATVLAAILEHTDGDDPLRRVCQAGMWLLPVDGASVSVMTDSAHRETLHASDDVNRRIEELQFTLGEGPCVEAFTTRRPVLVTNLATASTPLWPVFAEEMIGQPVGAIYAFPLRTATACVGAMEFYRRHPGELSAADLTIALRVVSVATALLLNHGSQADDAAETDDVAGAWWGRLTEDRRQVHQATGMLVGAFDIPADQAIALLRGYAFSTGRRIDEVARALTTGQLRPADLDR